MSQPLELSLKQKHDLKNALRTLELAIDEIKGGYRFDDNVATAKIDALERAVKLLTAHLQIP